MKCRRMDHGSRWSNSMTPLPGAVLFDNFQFVCLNSTIAECRQRGVQEEVGFALQALMEAPEQFKTQRRDLNTIKR